MEIENNNRRKLIRAKKRVEELKGFYVHFGVYLVVNVFITVIKVVRNMVEGETMGDALWDFGAFAVWLFWGIGLAFHAAKVFSYNPFLAKGWEERQIQKYMERDRDESQKFK